MRSTKWRRSKKTSKLRVTGLCTGNSPVTGEFLAQMAINVENVSIWWRHHKLFDVCQLPSTKEVPPNFVSKKDQYQNTMMTSPNENFFRVTGPVWEETTGNRWIPLTKASDAELWCFLWSAPEQTIEQTIETPVIWDAIVLIMTSCNDTQIKDNTLHVCGSIKHFTTIWMLGYHGCRLNAAAYVHLVEFELQMNAGRWTLWTTW